MDPQSNMASRQVISPTLVGRNDELAELLSAVTRAPAVAVIEGESGIGKTRLVTELAARPELAGHRILIGGCGRIREPFPLGPILDALRGMAAYLVPENLSPLTGVLRPLMPELAPLLPAAPEPLDDRAGERHRVFRALAEVLGSLGRVVLVAEDMHWADEQTVDFIGYLLADPPPELSVVITFRGEDVGLDVRTLTTRLPGSVARAHVILKPLNVEQTSVMMASILAADRISEEFAEYLCERTSGLPLVIQELLALLRDRGTLIRRGGGWARKTIDELNVPAGLRDLVLERVSRLSPGARAVAEAAAVLQVAVPVSVLVATGRVGREEALEGLDEVLQSGLFAERSGMMGFRHILAAQAVYESIPLPRRQSLHGRAATAVEALRPLPLGQVAHHLRHAGLVDAWVDAAEKAADQAFELGDDTEAAHLLGEVLEHANLGDERRTLLAVKLGWAATQLLHAPNVIDLLSDVLAQEPPGELRGQLRFLLGLLYERQGVEPERQRQIMAEAVEDLIGHRPDLAAWAMTGLGVPMVPGVPLAEHVTWLDRALESVSSIEDPVHTVFLLGKVAMVLTSIGDSRWAGLTDRILEMTGGSPRRRREVNAYYSLGQAACVAGWHELAERLLTAALAAADGCDSTRETEYVCRTDLALVAFCRGSWDELDEEIVFLVERLSDRPHNSIVVETVAACLALARGDAGARGALRDVIRRTTSSGAFDLLPFPVSAVIRLATAQGEPEAAIATTAETFAVWEAKELWPLAVRAMPALVEALVAAGRQAEAGELVERYELALHGLDAPLAPAALRHARGFLAEGTAAADHFLLAADVYGHLQCGYEAAQAEEEAAKRLFGLGDTRARQTLEAAMAAYEDMGARWDLDRVARIARRQGLSLPARHRGGTRGYGHSLSPRELEVARLAATGLTNKEIARELFLSAKTVDKHLGAALRKLGLHSRAALANHLPDEAVGSV
ncbi:LuxR C-terminal-related transcriptional regulator [Streptosporangium sp. NBC_01639]|uniref:AAA family ATPase n=1 Tax=Streptosporangium sp. NBC_01639 TaxID=2975948 RepID=UPI00386C2634|nr:LuxR C-terminal-related transcriptional regulator [Streptosporangium sp. NBC_01639]